MLRTESISTFLNEKLNAIGSTFIPSYSFEIFPDLGKNKENNNVKGVVKSFKGEMEPLINDIDVDYGFTCEIACPSAMSNFDIGNIRQIVDKFIEENNAREFEFDDGQAIVTFSTTIPKDFKVEFGFGDVTPLIFVIYVRYTKFAVTSNTKKWFLNDFEIPYLTENILLEKDGFTNKISGEDYAKTLLTNQTKFYKFTFQYDVKNELCSMLQKDILNGNFDKVYTLKYYDGNAFTEQEPFITNVSIYRNADASTQRTKVSMFNLMFTDVDNGQSGTKYYMALIDTPFDMGGENTRNFVADGDRTAQQVQIDYYNDKIQDGADYEQIKAPNLNSIDITSQVYKNTRNYDLFDLTNKNYAIIKVVKDDVVQRYYYYYVTNASIGANNQVLYDLKLDTVQSYLFQDNINIAECMIERVHLDRFSYYDPPPPSTDPGMYYFINSVNSELFERENIKDLSKRLIERQKLNFNIDLNRPFNRSELDEYLHDYITCWVYCYMSVGNYKLSPVGDEIELKGFNINLSEEETIPNSKFTAPYICVAFPIYKENKESGIENDIRPIEVVNSLSSGEPQILGEFNATAFDFFLSLNDGYSRIYSIKISGRPPFYTKKYGRTSYKLQFEKMQFEQNFSNGVFYPLVKGAGGVIFVMENHPDNIKTEDLYKSSSSNLFTDLIELDNIQTRFTKDEIVGSDKNYKFNPKLLNSDFRELRIGNNTSYYSYDLQKLDLKNLKFYFNESISPDITRQYVRCSTTDIFITQTQENFTGFVGQQDNSLPYSQNQLETFLANNKNFYLQRNVSTVSQIFGSLLGFGSSLASSFGKKDAIGSMQSPTFGLLGSGASIVSERINSNLSLDNMRNAPETLSNANGDAIYNAMISPTGIYLEIYEALPQELEIANDYMFMYGFAYNKIGKIKDFINKRKYFNFIQAQINSINGVSMSNTAREDLRQRFASGLRFWNNDTIQYEKENYELYLENDGAIPI